MALINTLKGQTPDGSSMILPIGGIANSTTTPLAANGVWDSGIIKYNGNEGVHFALQSDQAGNYVIEYYIGAQKVNFTGAVTNYDPSQVSAFQGALSGKGDGFKLIYTNGNVAQTSFYLEIRFGTAIQQTFRSLGVPASPTNMAGTAHAAIEGRENGTGLYKQATVTQNGLKVGSDVNIVNPGLQAQDSNGVLGPVQRLGNKLYAAPPLNDVFKNAAMITPSTVNDDILHGFSVRSTVTPITYLHFYNGNFTAAQLAAQTPYYTVVIPSTGVLADNGIDLLFPSGNITIAPSSSATGYTALATGLFVQALTRGI